MLLSIFLTTWIIISSKNKTHLIEPQKMVVSIIEKGDYIQTVKLYLTIWLLEEALKSIDYTIFYILIYKRHASLWWVYSERPSPPEISHVVILSRNVRLWVFYFIISEGISSHFFLNERSYQDYTWFVYYMLTVSINNLKGCAQSLGARRISWWPKHIHRK